MTRMHGRILTLALAAACAFGAVPAVATPQDDFNAVYADWKPDGVITACRFTQRQLQNAYDVATGSPDFQYSTGFQDDVQREVDRWKGSGCAGVMPGTVRNVSPLDGARIVGVSGRGPAAKERVKVRNTTRKTLPFAKATLRNRTKGTAAIPARFTLAAGKTAVVNFGCAPRKRRASFKGTTVWLCRKTQFFRDAGDLARLADPKGIVVSQLGYGSEKRRPAY
jgi:hypothetical protein